MAPRSDSYVRRLVPIDAARDALLHEVERGHHISLITGMMNHDSTVTYRMLRAPDGKRVKRETFEQMLVVAATLAKMPPGVRTPRRVLADPARERMRRMGAAGWSPTGICRDLGISDNFLHHSGAKWLTPEDAQVLREFFARTGEKSPEACGKRFSHVSARHWRERGYLPLAAESADDVPPMPMTRREERALGKRRLARKERREALLSAQYEREAVLDQERGEAA